MLTHGDSDHIGFAERLRSDHGVPVFVHAADAARTRTGEGPKTALGPMRLGPALGFFGYSIRKNGLRTRYLNEVTEISDGDVLELPGTPVIVGMPGHSPGSVAVHVPLADAVFVGDALTTRHVLTGRGGPQSARTMVSAIGLYRWRVAGLRPEGRERGGHRSVIAFVLGIRAHYCSWPAGRGRWRAGSRRSDGVMGWPVRDRNPSGGLPYHDRGADPVVSAGRNREVGEMSEASAVSPPTTRPSGALGRFGREFAYLLSGLPVGAAAFAVAIAGLAAGASTLVVLLGLPVLVGTLAAARAFARLERRQVERATGRALPPHHYRGTEEAGFTGWLHAVREPQSWRDLTYMVVAFPVRLTTFCFAITWTVGGVAELLYAAWSWPIPRDRDNTGVLDLAFGISSRGADIAFNTGVGAVLLVTAIPVVRGLVSLQTSLSRALLTNQTAALKARAEQLAAGRRSAVAAEAHTLRRLERDLHDGPQQRLVRLNMDLETVARRLEDAPERAKPLVEDMIEQSREALSEVRALSRGIAPPILADRGLAAALSAAAGRCPVPVSLQVDLPRRRYAAIAENTVYFVVTEALANIAKHAQATQCAVVVAADQTALRVQVRDDGRGGAHQGKGHGLAGLSDRLAAVDGTLDITSPPGGPTVLTAVVPLADH
ncbi:hypothetical protein GCM10009727_72110 [Actinomadura napierensis]|uniref:histidine kinase n=1 Tax=Actinomadura napierensis TaxID=267854 RepID=A0ABN3ACN6_9ACTN